MVCLCPCLEQQFRLLKGTRELTQTLRKVAKRTEKKLNDSAEQEEMIWGE